MRYIVGMILAAIVVYMIGVQISRYLRGEF